MYMQAIFAHVYKGQYITLPCRCERNTNELTLISFLVVASQNHKVYSIFNLNNVVYRSYDR